MSKWHDLSGERKKQLLLTTDKMGNRVGRATREECHTGSGIPHIAFVAFLFNDKNELYLQRRSLSKSLWDGFWDASVVSHVLPGETVEEAAQRRGREEMGVAVTFKDHGGFYYFAKYNGNCENEYCHVLTGISKEKISHNPLEISDVKLMKLASLKKQIKEKHEKYTPWLKLALEKFSGKLK